MGHVAPNLSNHGFSPLHSGLSGSHGPAPRRDAQAAQARTVPAPGDGTAPLDAQALAERYSAAYPSAQLESSIDGQIHAANQRIGAMRMLYGHVSEPEYRTGMDQALGQRAHLLQTLTAHVIESSSLPGGTHDLGRLEHRQLSLNSLERHLENYGYLLSPADHAAITNRMGALTKKIAQLKTQAGSQYRSTFAARHDTTTLLQRIQLNRQRDTSPKDLKSDIQALQYALGRDLNPQQRRQCEIEVGILADRYAAAVVPAAERPSEQALIHHIRHGEALMATLPPKSPQADQTRGELEKAYLKLAEGRSTQERAHAELAQGLSTLTAPWPQHGVEAEATKRIELADAFLQHPDIDSHIMDNVRAARRTAVAQKQEASDARFAADLHQSINAEPEAVADEPAAAHGQAASRDPFANWAHFDDNAFPSNAAGPSNEAAGSDVPHAQDAAANSNGAGTQARHETSPLSRTNSNASTATYSSAVEFHVPNQSQGPMRGNQTPTQSGNPFANLDPLASARNRNA